MESYAEKRPERSRQGWSAAAVIIGLYLLFEWNLNRMPDVAPPLITVTQFPTIGCVYSPAESLIRDRDSIEAALSGYEAAGKKPARFTLADKLRLVSENQPAITLLRQEMESGLQPPLICRDESILQSHRTAMGCSSFSMSDLLVLAGRTEAAASHWSDALDTDIDAVEFAANTSGIYGNVGGDRFHSVDRSARAAAWPCISHLTAAQAESAERRLAAFSAGKGGYGAVLAAEKECWQASLRYVFQQPDWQHRLYPFSGTNPWSELEVQSEWGWFAFKSKSAIYTSYTRKMDEVMRLAKLPWARGKPLLHQLDRRDMFTRDPIDSEEEECNYFELDALNKLLITQLALQAFHQDHSAYPLSLNQLVPAYLPALPLDPFSDDQPLCYRLKANGRPILYSIGPDAVDNGGAPIPYKAQNINDYGTPVINVQPVMYGDIVAGVDSGS